jgi:polar amino acid transport system substrate-binding protein
VKFLLVFVTVVISVGAYAKVIVSSDPYPPLIYTDSVGAAVGSVPEILPKILNLSSAEIEYRFSPWKRVLSDAEKGSVDIIGPLLITPDRAKYLVFTEPLMMAQISIWARRDNPKVQKFLNKQAKDFNDLKDLTFGQILGYSFGAKFGEFFNKPSVRKVEVVDMAQGVRMLVSKRIDVFLAYDPVIEFYFRELKIKKDEFVIIGEAARNLKYVMGISKKSILVDQLPQINQRILDLGNNSKSVK